MLTLVEVTVAAYLAGLLTHWWLSRKSRRTLRRYRAREAALRHWNRPVE